jgi:hypothetical protein
MPRSSNRPSPLPPELDPPTVEVNGKLYTGEVSLSSFSDTKYVMRVKFKHLFENCSARYMRDETALMQNHANSSLRTLVEQWLAEGHC